MEGAGGATLSGRAIPKSISRLRNNAGIPGTARPLAPSQGRCRLHTARPQRIWPPCVRWPPAPPRMPRSALRLFVHRFGSRSEADSASDNTGYRTWVQEGESGGGGTSLSGRPRSPPRGGKIREVCAGRFGAGAGFPLYLTSTRRPAAPAGRDGSLRSTTRRIVPCCTPRYAIAKAHSPPDTAGEPGIAARRVRPAARSPWARARKGGRVTCSSL